MILSKINDPSDFQIKEYTNISITNTCYVSTHVFLTIPTLPIESYLFLSPLEGTFRDSIARFRLTDGLYSWGFNNKILVRKKII